MATPALAQAQGLPNEAQQPGSPLAPRLVASGVAVLLHGGLAGLLLLAPATPPSPAMTEVPPILAVLAEPVTEESPALAPVPAEQAAAVPDAGAAPIEGAPTDAPPPQATPPEQTPPEPTPVTSAPVPVEPPPPAPEPPLPEAAQEPPPIPQRPPEPRAVPRPRPVVRPIPQSSSAVATPGTDVAAAAAPAPAARPAGPPPSYLQALAAALERRKRYPEPARARRAAGIALLRFTVTRDGRVAHWRIERSTGDADLDRAVEDMISRANLPAMPADMPGDSLEVAVPVRFQIR